MSLCVRAHDECVRVFDECVRVHDECVRVHDGCVWVHDVWGSIFTNCRQCLIFIAAADLCLQCLPLSPPLRTPDLCCP